MFLHETSDSIQHIIRKLICIKKLECANISLVFLMEQSVDDQALLAAADKIRSQYFPAKILLFGSRAKETNRPDSDIDLCIILENPKQRPLEISRNIRKEIYPLLHSSLDILVYDKKTFDERSAFPLTMEAEIIEHAREL